MSTSQSFILRIWLEETAEEAGQATWRGSITHVSSGERRYFEKLDAIAPIIALYLATWGVLLEEGERVSGGSERDETKEE
jgi:hypothetical protein